MNYRLIHQDFAHHHSATPIEQIGNWQVYAETDVAAGWPHNGVRLAMEMDEDQLADLRKRDKASSVDPKPLPKLETEPDLLN